jgi:hypothetical protein
MGQRAMYGLRELLQPLLWYYRVKPSVFACTIKSSHFI